MQAVGVSACTDITGFGLLGHACEMVRSNDFGMLIDSLRVPLFPEAREYAEKGLVPGGTYRNKEFFQQWVKADSRIPLYLQDLLLILRPLADC